MKRFAFVLIVLIILLGAGYYFWSHHQKSAPPQKMGGGLPVLTHMVKPQKLVVTLQAVGTLDGNESAMIKAEVPGLIKEIHFAEGQALKKDHLLVQIDPRNYRADLDLAKSAYEIARITYERNQQLRMADAVSKQVRDEDKSTMEQKLALQNTAQLQLFKTSIRAPFDGVVGFRKLSVGDFVDKGDVITQFVDYKKIKVEFSLPEKYFSELKLNQKITLNVDAWPHQYFEGKIYAFDPAIDISARLINVKAILDNKDGRLRPGMFANIHIQQREIPNALVIPEQGVIPQGDKFTAMAVENGKVKLKNIKIGVRQEGIVEVTDGLSANDQVITAGQMKVQEGMPVTAIPE